MSAIADFVLPSPVCLPVAHPKEGRKLLIESALSLLPADAPKAQQKLLILFGQDIATEDLCFFTPELLAKTAQTHWAMACENHKSCDSMIKVYTVPGGSELYQMTVVDITTKDMAFLVDSLVAEVNHRDLLIALLNHPILHMRYPDAGPCIPEDVQADPHKGYTARSHIHLQIRRVLSSEAQKDLAETLRKTLDDVRLANRDWQEMLCHMCTARDALQKVQGLSAQELETHRAFLDYLQDNNFTFLGYRAYRFEETSDGQVRSITVPKSSLGLLEDGICPAYLNESAEGLSSYLQALRRELPPVAISKTNKVSTVHRRVPMDAVTVKMYDQNGKTLGEHLFLGLFTSSTYSCSIRSVPCLKEKADALQASFGFIPGSHNHKTVRHILEKYPRDELFQMDVPALKETVSAIMRLAERQRIALFARNDKFGRYISCLVYIPRDRFSTDLRIRMKNILEKELSGHCSSFSIALDDSVFARVIYVIAVNEGAFPQYDARALEALLQDVGRTWPERLGAALADALEDDEEVSRLAIRYAESFPVGYREHYETRRAIYDMRHVEKVLEENRTVVELFCPSQTKQHCLRLKIYHPGAPVPLCDVLPILDNMGLRAVSELPFEIHPLNAEHSVWIHDFLLEIPAVGEPIHLKTIKRHFESAFLKIWTRETENDALNRLIVSAAMNWHEVAILRAYVRYMKQIKYLLGRAFVERTLIENPSISKLLVDLFKALHRPGLEEGQERPALVTMCRDKLSCVLEGVASLDQDRALRAIMGLIEATMRTNYFQKREGGLPKPYLSLKIESGKVEGLPLPRPFMEIFVSSPRMEGVHLRGDRIARGGLRWSDRHEDYRTEILGLMKAQMVKNAVIVPMGSKGGFVVKHPPKGGDRAALQAEGIACYQMLIRGLLDLTDNRVDNTIVGPKDVVRRDGDDPYLVVAADKGTATFSDIANAISGEYGFWLGDAFASGGSAGYDHKKMGITAKGGWESVKAHFRALGHDTQSQDFEVVGVGDMGGDVFGNALLLSPHIRLIGAFNHVHIFCDPNPDRAASLAERQRLFDGVLGWDSYNRALLSKGGCIYNRSDKILNLTPEIRARFDIEAERVSPTDLIRAILRARTDLLWFGGIGTYVKGAKESQNDVGDKANDTLRIDAVELRARVVGEGANMGVTQAARVEFSLRGGRINTDFIDNSAGVDCSDHEVNIKILMAEIMAKKGDMTLKKRDALLASMTDEVSRLVLRDNYEQALAVSMAEAGAESDATHHAALIETLEKNSGLIRAVEGLPEAEELAARAQNKRPGLTRPELCVLLAHAKIALTRTLLGSDVPDDPAMNPWLLAYFPEPLRQKYAQEITTHQLKREIIATALAGRIVNRMGSTFVADVCTKTDATAAAVVRAYLVVEEALGLPALWAGIEALDTKVSTHKQLIALRHIASVVTRAVQRLLVRSGICGTIEVGNFYAGMATLAASLESIAPPSLIAQLSTRAATFTEGDFPQKLAFDLAALPVLATGFDIFCVVRECQGAAFLAAAKTYFAVGERLHLDWLRNEARILPQGSSPWAEQATVAALDALYACQAGITARILRDMGGEADPVSAWAHACADRLAQVAPVLETLRTAQVFDLPMLIVAEQRLRGLYGG